MIGSDFKPTMLRYSRRCGECGRKMFIGHKYLASIKDGKIKKWVCSDRCRINFDNDFWQGIANRNQGIRK